MTRVIVLALALAACGRRADKAPPAPPPQDAAVVPDDPLAAVRWDDVTIDWTRPVPVTPDGGLVEPGYAGAASCTKCHAEIAASYAKHSMARTGLRPMAALDQAWLAKIFDAGAKTPVAHARSGFTYRPFRKDQAYFVEEVRVAKDGTALQSSVQPITHAFSAGSYGLAFFFEQGSRYFHVPIDYFAQLDRWDLDPFATGGNPRFSISLGPFCFSCHTDFPARSTTAEGVFYDPLPDGVGCERCHGPGARHNETQAAADIVEPSKLSPRLQLDVCTQCHLESSSIARAGRHPFEFRPGERLDDTRVNFLGEPAEADRVELLAHPARLVRSACFTGSNGAMTCTSCHDPHVSSFEQPETWWDARCESCHAKRPCTEDATVRAAEGDHCARCHMRPSSAANVPAVTITDHWIQTRPPPIRPGVLDKPASLIAWSTYLGDPATGEDLAAVEAAAYAKAGLVEEAAKRGAKALADRPRVIELYRLPAGRARSMGNLDELARVWGAVLRYDLDATSALQGYALAMLDLGTPAAHAEATQALDRLVLLDPDHAKALETQGIAAFRDGRLDEARAKFERAVAASPSAAASHAGLAALALQEGRRADAIAHLEAARRIEVADSWILDQLAAAYREANDPAAADAIDELRTVLTAEGHAPSRTPAAAWIR